MRTFTIASCYGTPYCYDYVIYLNLRKEIEKMGYIYDKESLNKIYMLGFPIRSSYPSCGKYNPNGLNIGLTGSYFPQITKEELKKLNFIYCSSTFGYEYILKNFDVMPDGIWNPYSPFGNSELPDFLLTNQTIELPSIDIGFVGNARSRPAIELLVPLLKKHPEWTFQWHGYGIENYQGSAEVKKYWSGKSLPYSQYPEFATKTKIVLVDMHEEMNAIGSPSFKYIDHIMSGSFVMVYNNKYAEHIKGISFINSIDLENKIALYLSNENERKRISNLQHNLIKEVNSVKRTATLLTGVIEQYGK